MAKVKEITLTPGWLKRDIERAKARLEQWMPFEWEYEDRRKNNMKIIRHEPPLYRLESSPIGYATLLEPF